MVVRNIPPRCKTEVTRFLASIERCNAYDESQVLSNCFIAVQIVCRGPLGEPTYRTYTRLVPSMIRVLSLQSNSWGRRNKKTKRKFHFTDTRPRSPAVQNNYGVTSLTKSWSSSVFKSETARNSNPLFSHESTL